MSDELASIDVLLQSRTNLSELAFMRVSLRYSTKCSRMGEPMFSYLIVFEKLRTGASQAPAAEPPETLQQHARRQGNNFIGSRECSNT